MAILIKSNHENYHKCYMLNDIMTSCEQLTNITCFYTNWTYGIMYSNTTWIHYKNRFYMKCFAFLSAAIWCRSHHF